MLQLGLDEILDVFAPNLSPSFYIAWGLEENRTVNGIERYHLKQNVGDGHRPGHDLRISGSKGSGSGVFPGGKSIDNVFLDRGLGAIAQGGQHPIAVESLQDVVLPVAQLSGK